MKKITRIIGVLSLLLVIVTLICTIADKRQLQHNLIRFHVIANSDSAIDQAHKLQVRDAVIKYLQPKLKGVSNKEQAKAFLQEQLTEIETIANRTLEKAGITHKAHALLSLESYKTRFYDTFKLPAGVYESLRIEIGAGEGKNWWCVVFPSLCLPATTEAFQNIAVSTGFGRSLVNTLSNKDGFEIRFFLLDCLGRIENFLYKD